MRNFNESECCEQTSGLGRLGACDVAYSEKQKEGQITRSMRSLADANMQLESVVANLSNKLQPITNYELKPEDRECATPFSGCDLSRGIFDEASKVRSQANTINEIINALDI